MASAFLLSTTVTRAGNAECQAGVRPGMDCTLSPRQLSSPTSTAPEAVSTEPTARGALWAQRSRPPCPPNGHGRALDRTLGLGYRWCHWAYAYQGPERPHQRLGSCSPTLGPGEHRSTSPLTDPIGCVGQWLAAFKLTKADVLARQFVPSANACRSIFHHAQRHRLWSAHTAASPSRWRRIPR